MDALHKEFWLIVFMAIVASIGIRLFTQNAGVLAKDAGLK